MSISTIIMASCSTPNCSKEKGSTSHCIEHHIRFNKVYLRYKELHSQLTTPDISKLSLDEIKLLYRRYYRVHKLRVWYMNHAFREELRDEGHKQMAENLYTYMNLLIRKMEDITKDYKEEVDEKIESSDDSETEEDTTEEPQTISLLLKKHKKVNVLLSDRRLRCLNRAIDIDTMNRVRLLKFFAMRIIHPELVRVTVRQEAVGKDVLGDIFRKREGISILVANKVFEIFTLIISNLVFTDITKIEVLPIFLDETITVPLPCCIKLAALLLSEYFDYCRAMVLLGAQLTVFKVDMLIYFEETDDKYIVKSKTQGKDFALGMGFAMDELKRIAPLFILYKKDLEHTHLQTSKQCNHCIEEIDKDMDYGVLHPKI